MSCCWGECDSEVMLVNVDEDDDDDGPVVSFFFLYSKSNKLYDGVIINVRRVNIRKRFKFSTIEKSVITKMSLES